MAAQAGTPRLLRGINDRSALDLLLEHGPLSRSQLGELTGLSKPTVSQLLARLEAPAWSSSAGAARGGPAPRPSSTRSTRTPPTSPGSTSRRPASCGGRRHHRAHRRRVRAADAGAGGADTVERVSEALDGAAGERRARPPRLHRLVIGTPGAFDPRPSGSGTRGTCPGWHDPDLLDRLADAVGRSARGRQRRQPGGDRRAAVGRARGSADFVLLWGEEGLGAAIVIDGALHRGATGGAGEVGLPARCPARRWCATSAATTPAGSRSSPAAKPGPRARPGATACGPHRRRPPSHGAGRRRAQATSCSTELGAPVALGLAAIVAVLDPELVILTGGVLNAGGERLLELVRTEFADLAVPGRDRAHRRNGQAGAARGPAQRARRDP